MKLDSNVKLKSKYWNLIPWISDQTATALYPNIYFPKNIHKDLQKTSPDSLNIAHLIHEQTHIKRIKKAGVLKFALKYFFDPGFRVAEELIAIKASMKFIKSKKLTWDINNSAKHLSGWLYLWPISYISVKERLEKIWKEI